MNQLPDSFFVCLDRSSILFLEFSAKVHKNTDLGKYYRRKMQIFLFF